MTREEAMSYIIPAIERTWNDKICKQIKEVLNEQPCEDAISRQAAIRLAEQGQVQGFEWQFKELVKLPSVSTEKTWQCKNCKWWKDSDGEYRRGVRAESKCPINRKEVYEGNGYCFMFEPQESEVRNEKSNTTERVRKMGKV